MENINIVYSTNDYYFIQTLVSIISILENNKDVSINFYILVQNITPNKNKKIELMKKKFNCNISLIEINNDKLAKLKAKSYLSMETYFRFFIPNILKNEKKTLYIDSDTMVIGSIKELYNTNIDDCYVAGAPDYTIDNNITNHKKDINFPQEYTYVNGGVLLFNLEKMRNDNLGEKLIDFSIKNNFTLADQDALNIYLAGKIKTFDSIYNFQTISYTYEKEKVDSIVIAHWSGPGKPWDTPIRVQKAEKWYEYYSMLPFEKFLPPPPRIKEYSLCNLIKIGISGNLVILNIFGIKIKFKTKTKKKPAVL